MKDDHCSHCGNGLAPTEYPRKCGACGAEAYSNPTPVCLVLVPVGDGVLLIRRGIEPEIGKLALPGGYMNLGESWQEACVRELREETGVVVDPAAVRLVQLHSDRRHVLVFAEVPEIENLDVSKLTFDFEVQELVVSSDPDDITPAFQLHRNVMRDFLRIRQIARDHADW